MRELAVGDCVVYRKYKVSPHPTVRAKEVYPSQFGETYSYAVDKYWVVSAVPDSEKVEVVTRSGKVHYLDAIDPNLRKASFFEKLRLRERFPQLAEVIGWRNMLLHPRWNPHHEDWERELFLLYALMFLVAVTSIVWHLTRLH